MVFTPHGSFMTNQFVPTPAAAEMLKRDGKLRYLPFEEVRDGPLDTQPVCGADENPLQEIIEEELQQERAMGSQQQERAIGSQREEQPPTEVQSWGFQEHENDWDVAWKDAQQHGRTLPFTTRTRLDITLGGLGMSRRATPLRRKTCCTGQR